ncbi:hypothetical protein AB6A40_005288 [Gnathostoma spinigerum]|uniref:beta-N-acetylhexosaminidase n=1 Tax=Gnathostoma spinigerum TaxID=75299 RepID=A0ABD6EK94_9BILA
MRPSNLCRSRAMARFLTFRRMTVFGVVFFVIYVSCVLCMHTFMKQSTTRSDNPSTLSNKLEERDPNNLQNIQTEDENNDVYLPYGETRYPRLVEGKFIAPNRIFHLDLKGAAPKTSYLEKLIPLIRQMGGTGILIEYEDMFPYAGELSGLRAANAYSQTDLRHILQLAVDNHLTVIPLVQTFGHLEWILKYEEYAKYREEMRYPQVICLADEGAVHIVEEAIRQVMQLHEDFSLTAFHIGADEAFQVGQCKKDLAMMQTKRVGPNALMLLHIIRIAKFVKSLAKNHVRVLMWHDMLEKVDFDSISRYGLRNLVEPVVWKYEEELEGVLYPEFWQKMAANFPYVWGASAFKGADGPDQYASNIPHYVANHISWMKQMNDNYEYFKQFRGLIVTGWQRFDHFAILCETLPVGLPSAAVNLAILKDGRGVEDAARRAGMVLNCSSSIVLSFPTGLAAYCNFPGFEIYKNVQQFQELVTSIERDVFNNYQIRGWMSEFNDKYRYSQLWYVDNCSFRVRLALADIKRYADLIKNSMEEVFYEDTVQEFLYEYVRPVQQRLIELNRRLDRLSSHRVYPRRPFPVNSSV